MNLAGIPTEGSLVQALEDALPGLVTNVYAHPAGGGSTSASCRSTSATTTTMT